MEDGKHVEGALELGAAQHDPIGVLRRPAGFVIVQLNRVARAAEIKAIVPGAWSMRH
jgi:hypothetical protein